MRILSESCWCVWLAISQYTIQNRIVTAIANTTTCTIARRSPALRASLASFMHRVAGAAHGMDQLGLARAADLPSQPADMALDGTVRLRAARACCGGDEGLGHGRELGAHSLSQLVRGDSV